LAFRDFPVSAAFVPHSRAPARQGEIISSLVFITPLQRKKIGSVSEKMASQR